MSYLAVSSFSLHSGLGPLRFDLREPDGSLGELVIDMPQRHSLEEFAVLAREFVGVSAIELCQIQFDSATPARIDRLKEGLNAAGVRLLTVPIDIGDLASPNADWVAQDMKRIISWFDIAQTLGAEYVRVNAGAPGSWDIQSDRTDLIEALRQLADAAGERSMRLLVENHGGASSQPDLLLALCHDVGVDRLGILLDLGNFQPLIGLTRARLTDPDADDTDLDLEPVYASIAQLAPFADLVHAKSVDPASDGSPLPDLSRALEIVRNAGYQGHVSIEWEGHQGDAWTQTADVARQVRAVFPELV